MRSKTLKDFREGNDVERDTREQHVADVKVCDRRPFQPRAAKASRTRDKPYNELLENGVN